MLQMTFDGAVPGGYKCHLCNITFTQEFNLQHHYNIRHKEVPFRKYDKECMICGRKYSKSSHLTAHVTAKHSFAKMFKCEICDKTFGYQCSLKLHVKTLHNH